MPAPFAAKQTEAQEVAWVEDGPHSTGPKQLASSPHSSHPHSCSLYTAGCCHQTRTRTAEVLSKAPSEWPRIKVIWSRSLLQKGSSWGVPG